MISAGAALSSSYDYGEVARSILIAFAASYAALDLAGRVTVASGRARARWLAGGAIAMGLGIWEMHFKGMLAFRLPVPIAYYWPTVLASFVVAAVTSAIALFLVSRPKMGPVRLWTGSLVMGSGIAALHYMDMAAMRLAAVTRFDPRIVILSIVLAIAFSFAALALAFGLREETRGTPSRRIASAVVMGAAITAMHYTGMASASFFASPLVPNLSHAVNVSPLANAGVGTITLLVLGAAIVTSAADRGLSLQAQELERRVSERTRELSMANEAMEGLEEMICVVDRDYRYVFANRAFLSYRGLDREQVVGHLIPELLDPGVFETVVKQKLDECFQGNVVTYELKYTYPKLGERDLSSSYFPVEGPSGIDRVACVLQDITERKRAEQALRKSEERFRLAAQAGKMFAYEWDVSTDVIVRSAEAAQVLRIAETASLTGQQALAAVHPDDRERVSASVANLTPERPDLRISYRMIRPDGDVIMVERNSRAHFDKQGRLVRVVGMITDITERKHAEQSLQEAQAELAHVTRALTMGELVASIAHEVYQPLTAILTTGSLVQRQLATNNPNLVEVQQAITEIVEDANRISAIISRVRTLLSRDVPDRVELNVNDVILDVIVLVRSEAVRSGAELRLDLGAHLPPVLGDRVQLQQVLINLVMNGIDAMRTVTDRLRLLDIQSRKHAEGVIIRVQDSGIGVDPHTLDRIFEPFFTTKPQGIGIGLSISRSIVESHGGRLWAEPASVGSIFQVILPSAQGS